MEILLTFFGVIIIIILLVICIFMYDIKQKLDSIPSQLRQTVMNYLEAEVEFMQKQVKEVKDAMGIGKEK